MDVFPASEAHIALVVQPLVLAVGQRALLFCYLMRVHGLLGHDRVLVVVLLWQEPSVQLFQISGELDCFQKLDFVGVVLLLRLTVAATVQRPASV